MYVPECSFLVDGLGIPQPDLEMKSIQIVPCEVRTTSTHGLVVSDVELTDCLSYVELTICLRVTESALTGPKRSLSYLVLVTKPAVIPFEAHLKDTFPNTFVFSLTHTILS